VSDSATGSHQIQLTRLDILNRANAVAVLELALDHPGCGLQTGVWMCCDNHAFILGGWTEVVRKCPCANHSLASIRQGSSNLDSRAGRELHEARFKQHF
jgi:hypothetical protein